MLKQNTSLLVLVIWILRSAKLESNFSAENKHQDNGNVSIPKSNVNHQGLASIFSPRMDFDRWKPLTGRGDPLRNDPTYDYEPPVLERVHYWADDTRLEREKHPERKSEVLVLGVSSRKPSIASKPPTPHRRTPRPPAVLQKYEDFSYKLSNDYPMTILVPPPPPPPGHKPLLFIIANENTPTPTTPKYVESTLVTKEVTPTVDLITSYALQEANLIYQSSTRHDWYEEQNKTNNFSNVAATSDYAGWGPTTPLDDDTINETHNIIPLDNSIHQLPRQKYLFPRPMYSEAPPPSLLTVNSLPSFLPTVVPPTTSNIIQETWPTTDPTLDVTTESQKIFEQTSTERYSVIPIQTTPTPLPVTKQKPSMVDMLAPMMSMPMVTDPNRPEDNIYAHASENIHIFKEPEIRDDMQLEIMQTMQPPPPVQTLDSATESYNNYFAENSQALNMPSNKKTGGQTHDPYLHMRFTTPAPTAETVPRDIKPTTEKQHSMPTYLIIQGHSKVKTYGSKPKSSQNIVSNEIPNPNETNEVKHLHPIKEKKKNVDFKSTGREGRSKNLKSLIDKGYGSIEIQEADVGIKYDISDGSDVPVEIYKKGIVDNDENNYVVVAKKNTDKRTKRQIDLENLLPFDEDSLEEFVYDFFNNRQNSTGIVGLIAQTVTNEKVASVVDNLEDDDEDDDVSESSEDR